MPDCELREAVWRRGPGIVLKALLVRSEIYKSLETRHERYER